MRAIRGTLNAQRHGAVGAAYGQLASEGGEVKKKDLMKRHRRADTDKVMKALGDNSFDGVITRAEWFDYYSGVSANFDTDEGFELMIRNAWHLAGGSGGAANTANVRVLVTRLDGSKSVECIENDLGLDMRDHAAVLTRLKEQGIWDAVAAERVSAL